MTDPWPCWTCRHRFGPDGAGTYSCSRPVSTRVAIWERWNLDHASTRWRELGFERELRGETECERPDCPVAEREVVQ